MALPNSPFGLHQASPPQQKVKVSAGSQAPHNGFLGRRIGKNIGAGVVLPQGAGFIRTQLFHRQGRTVAIHTFLHDKKIKSITIGVQTERHGHVTPIKIDPQKVSGS